jgi:hypothetical protein
VQFHNIVVLLLAFVVEKREKYFLCVFFFKKLLSPLKNIYMRSSREKFFLKQGEECLMFLVE